MTAHVVVDDGAIEGWFRNSKLLRCYLLIRSALEVGEPSETSVDGNVLENQPVYAANKRPSFGCLLFVVRKLAVEDGQESAERIHERDARREHRLDHNLGLPRYHGFILRSFSLMLERMVEVKLSHV
jgi:hypothetical protein